MKRKQTENNTVFIGFRAGLETRKQLEQLAKRDSRSVGTTVRLIVEEKLSMLKNS